MHPLQLLADEPPRRSRRTRQHPRIVEPRRGDNAHVAARRPMRRAGTATEHLSCWVNPAKARHVEPLWGELGCNTWGMGYGTEASLAG